jgi:putative phage-type endonuclease
MDLSQYLTTCRVFSTVSQQEDEAGWLAARSRGIGGSDIGPICGVSVFTTARQIYLRKTGQYPDSLSKDEASSERMHFGHMLEPIVADEYARRELCEGGSHPDLHLVNYEATLQHNDYPWALANVDRFIVDKEGRPVGILECKTTSEYMNDEWADGEILTTYLYQLNWYLFVTGLKWGAFACLVGGNKFYTYEVVRNDELINDILIPKAREFWEVNVMQLKEPEMQQNDTDFVNGLYNKAVKNSEISFTDDGFNELAKTVFDCKKKIKELESIMEEAQNRIKDRMKDNEIAYCADFTVKWSPRSQSRVDTALLKAEYPKAYMDCLKKVEYRTMTVKAMKE